MRTAKIYFVYNMSNRCKTLYSESQGISFGVCASTGWGLVPALPRNISLIAWFTLSNFERFEDIRNAIEREKTIQGWLRIKKIAIIVSINPAWRNLSIEWYQRHPFQPEINTGELHVKQEPYCVINVSS